MTLNARYAHTNLVARDWRKLADFYEGVFGCKRVPPERKIRGQWLDDATGVADARISGIHLRLPGFGDEGPTLEIFQYGRLEASLEPVANRPGFGHIAFAVDDVQAAYDAVLAAGGREVGKVVTTEIPDAGKIAFVYVADPEGNIIELQKWVRRR
jgi:predicted enzyme related to lactoylglutathione lyase